MRRHKWQDNMNLYENQRWNQMLRKGSKSFSACGTRHDVPYVVSRHETYSWQQYHGLRMSLAMVVTGHWDTIRECQRMITTKTLFKCWSQSNFFETLTEKLLFVIYTWYISYHWMFILHICVAYNAVTKLCDLTHLL